MVRSIVKNGIKRGKKLLGGRQESIASAAFVMMALIAITKLVGFVKLHLLARIFGASPELDLFWAASTIPDAIFNIIVLGTINAALIPTFAEKLSGGKAGKADKSGKMDEASEKANIANMAGLFSNVVNLFVVVFLVLGVLVYIFAPQLSRMIAHGGLGGFGYEATGDFTASDVDIIARLMRIMVFSPIILGVSSVFTAALQANKRFIVPALAPLLYNFGIIAGAVVLAWWLDMGVVGLAIGVVIGALMHLLVQIPFVQSLGLRFRHTLEFLTEEVKKVIELGLPRIAGTLIEQVGIFVNTFIGMGLGGGALSAFKFGSSLYLVPVQLIGATFAQAALPTLSVEYQDVLGDRAGKKDKGGDKDENVLDEFRNTFLNSLQQILFFVFPAVVFVVVLRLPIVRLVLGAGEFDWTDTVMTSWVLALFGVAIVMQSVVALLLRAFYAMQDSKVPVVVAIIGLIASVIGAVYLTNFFSHYYDWRPLLNSMIDHSKPVSAELFGDLSTWMTTRNTSIAAVGGLALSMGIALFSEAVFMFAVLHKRVKVLSWHGFWRPTLRKFFAAGVMFLAMYTLFKFWNFNLDTSTGISIVLLFLINGGIGLAVYAGVCAVIDISEVNFFVEFAKKLNANVRKVFRNGNGMKGGVVQEGSL